MDYTLALTPALSPEERGRRSRRWRKTTRPGVGAPSGRKGNHATDATEAIELSNSARTLSLSPGVRAGVRASLLLADQALGRSQSSGKGCPLVSGAQ